MSPHRVDQLNIGLILLSLIAAFLLPFHLFLFAYAVLGPLHYLTEIAWLKKQQYFLKKKNDHYPLFILGVLIFLNAYVLTLPGVTGQGLVYIAFLGAFALLFLKKRSHRIAAFAGIIATSLIVSDFPISGIFFGILLTTIIHVFIFTAAFMLYGALKSKSKWGLAGVFLLIVSSIACLLPIYGELGPINEYIRKSYLDFQALNQVLMNMMNLQGDIFQSLEGISIMRFIAFAYTYHYLNWFSKTSIIGWYQASKKYFALICIAWIASVAIYAYDYRLGLACLYFLSMLHVFLEFPLNFHSFKGISTELSKILRSSQS